MVSCKSCKSLHYQLIYIYFTLKSSGSCGGRLLGRISGLGHKSTGMLRSAFVTLQVLQVVVMCSSLSCEACTHAWMQCTCTACPHCIGAQTFASCSMSSKHIGHIKSAMYVCVCCLPNRMLFEISKSLSWRTGWKTTGDGVFCKPMCCSYIYSVCCCTGSTCDCGSRVQHADFPKYHSALEAFSNPKWRSLARMLNSLLRSALLRYLEINESNWNVDLPNN